MSNNGKPTQRATEAHTCGGSSSTGPSGPAVGHLPVTMRRSQNEASSVQAANAIVRACERASGITQRSAPLSPQQRHMCVWERAGARAPPALNTCRANLTKHGVECERSTAHTRTRTRTQRAPTSMPVTAYSIISAWGPEFLRQLEKEAAASAGKPGLAALDGPLPQVSSRPPPRPILVDAHQVEMLQSLGKLRRERGPGRFVFIKTASGATARFISPPKKWWAPVVALTLR